MSKGCDEESADAERDGSERKGQRWARRDVRSGQNGEDGEKDDEVDDDLRMSEREGRICCCLFCCGIYPLLLRLLFVCAFRSGY